MLTGLYHLGVVELWSEGVKNWKQLEEGNTRESGKNHRKGIQTAGEGYPKEYIRSWEQKITEHKETLSL